MDELEQRDYERNIELENKQIDFEIEQALKDGDNQRAKELDDRRTSNDMRLEAIKTANTQAEISLRGTEDRDTISYRDTFTPEGEEGPTYSDTVIAKSIERKIDTATQEGLQGIGTTYGGNGEIIKPELQARDEETIALDEVSKWLIENANSINEQQFSKIKLDYGLNDDYIEQVLVNMQEEDKAKGIEESYSRYAEARR